MAKKRTLFDDKPKEIQELTYLIKQDINNLHGEITRLQSFVKTQQENDSKNMQKHSSNVVYTLQSKLANVSKDFKQVLEVRNEVNFDLFHLRFAHVIPCCGENWFFIF